MLQSLCCLSIMPQRKRHKLQTPVVSPEEEAEAKKCLENTNNQKKTHSSMTWYLKSVHAKPEYDGWSIGAQREYFIAPTAEHLKTRGAKVQRSWRSVETAKQKEKQYVWMSFEQLKNSKGEKKAKLLTQSGKLSHRPCPITGDDSTFGREWRIPTACFLRWCLRKRMHPAVLLPLMHQPIAPRGP